MPIESLARRRIVYSVRVRIYAASHKPKYLKALVSSVVGSWWSYTYAQFCFWWFF